MNKLSRKDIVNEAKCIIAVRSNSRYGAALIDVSKGVLLEHMRRGWCDKGSVIEEKTTMNGWRYLVIKRTTTYHILLDWQAILELPELQKITVSSEPYCAGNATPYFYVNHTKHQNIFKTMEELVDRAKAEREDITNMNIIEKPGVYHHEHLNLYITHEDGNMCLTSDVNKATIYDTEIETHFTQQYIELKEVVKKDHYEEILIKRIQTDHLKLTEVEVSIAVKK